MDVPTPPLPTVAEYAALAGTDPIVEGDLHRQAIDHVLGSLRDAEAMTDGAPRQVSGALSRASQSIEERLLEEFGHYPEVLARALTTHLIDDYMVSTGRGKR